MRMPIAIYPIGLVLLLSIRTGHYSFAGLLSGTYVVANGVGTPVLGRLVDRYGQHRVLIPASAGHIAAAIALGLLVGANAPDAVLLAPATVLGFCYLSVGSLTRARWSFVLAGRPELNTGYSVESILDELIFTVGPLIATLIATQIDPLGVLVVGSRIGGRRRRLASAAAVHRAAGPPGRSGSSSQCVALCRPAAPHSGWGGHGRGVRERRGHSDRVLRPARCHGLERAGTGRFRHR